MRGTTPVNDDNGWKPVGAQHIIVEVIDFGLWIDGEMFSEKDELEGTTNE